MHSASACPEQGYIPRLGLVNESRYACLTETGTRNQLLVEGGTVISLGPTGTSRPFHPLTGALAHFGPFSSLEVMRSILPNAPTDLCYWQGILADSRETLCFPQTSLDDTLRTDPDVSNCGNSFQYLHSKSTGL